MRYRSRKKFDHIFSRLDTIHQRDGRTDTERQQRALSRLASRGKNAAKYAKQNFWQSEID